MNENNRFEPFKTPPPPKLMYNLDDILTISLQFFVHLQVV